MQAAADEALVRAALRGVMGPGGADLVSAGLVEGVAVRDGLVQVSLGVSRDQASALEPARLAAERVIRALPGVRSAAVVLTAARAVAPATTAKPHVPARLLADIPIVIAVASGKGGVGKSTVATNLALSLAGRGAQIGLLDTDIYGPSLPRMLGVGGQPEVRAGIMRPIEAFGLRCMSIGFLVPEDQAMIWRGPMVMGALTQMLGQTEWGALDAIVLDLPPGTGDVPLTLAQKVAVTGAVIVSTPQDIALIDARRGVAMFQKMNVPILGIVENMSFFQCPQCGARSEVFGHGGARAEASRIGVPFLGEVPLLPAVREAGDAGVPVVAAAPGSAAAVAFEGIADRVWDAVGRKGGRARRSPTPPPSV